MPIPGTMTGGSSITGVAPSPTIAGTTGGVAVGMTVSGVAYDHVANGVQFAELIPYSRDSFPSLRLVVKGRPIKLPATDPFLGNTVLVAIDCGTGNGSVLRFAGDFTECEVDYVENIGWTRNYTALGLRYRADTIPFTNSNNGSDIASFNLDPGDTNYLSEFAGRSVGQILQYCLDLPDNSAALNNLGIGNYVTTGFGATATCTLAGTAVGSVVSITSGGAGYAAAPTVIFDGGGGHGAQGVAHINSGSVSGVTVISGGIGYSAPPNIILSGLPAVTLNDLAGLTTIYPSPTYVQGEKLGSAIDQSLRQLAPNYAFHIDPQANMRFLDLRSLGQPLFLFVNCPGAGAQATATVVNGVITAATVTSGGTGYDPSNLPTILIVDATGTGATATCSVSGGVVVAVTITSGGSHYSSPRTLQLGYDLIDVGAMKVYQSVRDSFPRVEVRGTQQIEGIYFETAAPPGSTVSGATNGLAEDFAHDGLTNAQAKAAWSLLDVNEPGVDPGQASVTVNVNATTHVISGTSNLNGGYGYTTTPVIHLSGGGGTGGSLTASIAGGSVVAVSIHAAGTGYSSAPTAVIDSAGGANSDVGTCTITSTTSVAITSSDAFKCWPSGYWDQSSSGRHGQIVLVDPITTGVNARTRANIISHPALTAGGNCTLTIDQTLPLTSYTSYTIIGYAGGATNVWRLYKITDPAMALAMQTTSALPLPFINSSGNQATMVTTPQCEILWSANGAAPFQSRSVDIQIDPVAGTVLTAYAVVEAFGSESANKIGGSSTTGVPASVRAMIPIAKGKLLAIYPPNDSLGGAVYAGSSHTVAGLERTLVITAPGWKYIGNQANMEAYAADMFDAYSEIRTEWNVPYIGIYEPALAFGLALNLSGNGYPTGLETANIPVLECALTWDLSNSGPKFHTQMQASNRRAPHAAALYQRPTPIPWHLGVEGTFSADPTLNNSPVSTAQNLGLDFSTEEGE